MFSLGKTPVRSAPWFKSTTKGFSATKEPFIARDKTPRGLDLRKPILPNDLQQY